MNTESILILGAGLMQKPAILSAKSLGLKVFLIDANPNAVCVPLADEFKQIDLKARNEIADYALELKEKENLISVFTAGTDFSASVSYACEKANLKSHSFKASLNASEKNLMRSCFDKENVPSPKFVKISDNDVSNILTKDFIKASKYPLVVKPVDNMGARGCRMIRDESELIFSVNEAIKNSRSKNCILEEYMEGPEFSIDALVYDGTMTITGFADRHIFFPPYFIEMGHTMPTRISKDKYNELIKTFALGVKALGLTTGAAKADIKYTKNGPMIGEIAARLSGGYMSGWTFPYSSDFNLTKVAIEISCGKKPLEMERLRKELFIDAPFKMYEVPSKKVSAERAWISIPGIVKNVYGLDEKLHNENIKNIFPRVKPGDKVVFPRNNVEKCGNIISLANDFETAINSCENIIKNITIELEKNVKETTDFLEGKNVQFEKNFPRNSFKLSDNIIEELNLELKNSDFEIPENESVSKFIPQALNKPEILKIKDWNYLTLLETIEKFDLLKPVHKKISYKRFWQYLVNGGIQGALYAAE